MQEVIIFITSLTLVICFFLKKSRVVSSLFYGISSLSLSYFSFEYKFNFQYILNLYLLSQLLTLLRIEVGDYRFILKKSFLSILSFLFCSIIYLGTGSEEVALFFTPTAELFIFLSAFSLVVVNFLTISDFKNKSEVDYPLTVLAGSLSAAYLLINLMSSADAMIIQSVEFFMRAFFLILTVFFTLFELTSKKSKRERVLMYSLTGLLFIYLNSSIKDIDFLVLIGISCLVLFEFKNKFVMSLFCLVPFSPLVIYLFSRVTEQNTFTYLDITTISLIFYCSYRSLSKNSFNQSTKLTYNVSKYGK